MVPFYLQSYAMEGKWWAGRVKNVVTSRTKTMADVAVDGDPNRVQKVVLLGEWTNCCLKKGDDVSYLLPTGHLGTAVFSADSQTLLVINPERMMSVTAITSAISCQRRGALTALMPNAGVAESYPQWRGLVAHSCVESVLSNRGYEIGNLDTIRAEAVRKWSSGVKSLTRVEWEAALKKDWPSLSESMMHLVTRYLTFLESVVAVSNNLRFDYRLRGEDCQIMMRKDGICDVFRASCKLLDVKATQEVEATIRSNKLGVKGRADILLKGEETSRPLEMKTGNGKLFIPAHWAQVALYAAIITENETEGAILKLESKTTAGLIVYLGDNPVVKEVKFNFSEIKELIIVRNKLCSEALPGCKESKECGFCPQALSCSLLHVGGELGECSNILEAKMRRETVQNHLTFGDKEFADRYKINITCLSVQRKGIISGG